MTNMPLGLESPRPSTFQRPTRTIRTSAAALLVAALAACSATAGPSASPGATSNPTIGPTPSPTALVGLEHPTGAKDIVLRFEESGGFVPVEYNATYAPSFTLYGDGTLVFKDPYAPAPETNDNVVRAVPFLIAKLDEASVQALLEDALGPGGLGIAQGPYTCNCADIPTSTFTISVGGKTKQVNVTGLSPEEHAQNKQIVTALSAFAAKLRGFADVLGNEQPYAPAAYRGILIEVEQPAGPVVAWPWSDLTPADFVGGENELFKTRDMTPAEVENLGIKDVTGGVIGVSVGSEGKVYTFSLRPLLPDELG